MQRTVQNITLVTVSGSDNGICASQTPSGAGNLLLNGSLTSNGLYLATDLAHQLIISTGASESSNTFKITGTNSDGVTQSETITGPNATTATSSNYYNSVTSISISGAASGTVVVGITSVGLSRTIKINTSNPNMQVANAFVISGTINYTLQHTFDSIMNTPNNTTVQYKPTTPGYFADATIASQTSNKAALLALPVNASQLLVNSYSTGATIRWLIVENYK